jgi:hypothetical protein
MNRHYEENGLTTRMARFACRTSYADIPVPVVEYVKVMVADSLACAFGASVLPGARNLVKVPEKWGGPEDAVILTTGKKVGAAAAAFANAYLINALDADDTFYTNGHPLAPISPARSPSPRKRAPRARSSSPRSRSATTWRSASSGRSARSWAARSALT